MNHVNQNSANTEKQENVLNGTLGAFLFALGGGIVWVLLDLIGFYAAITGVVTAFCAVQGYRILGGKLTKRGVIIAAVAAFIVMVLAWYFCLSRDFYVATGEWLANGEIEERPGFAQCFANAYRLLSDPGIAKSYLLSLGLGMGFAVLGSYGYFVQVFRAAKQEERNAREAAEVSAPGETPAYSETDRQPESGTGTPPEENEAASDRSASEEEKN